MIMKTVTIDKAFSGLSDLTKINKVAGMSADGNVGGLIDLLTLMLNAGAIIKKDLLNSTNDLNTIQDGIYDFYIEQGLPQNIPSNVERRIVLQINTKRHKIQIVFNISFNRIVYRGGTIHSNVWGEWGAFFFT